MIDRTPPEADTKSEDAASSASKPKRYVGFGETVAYGLGGIATDLPGRMIGSFVNPFFNILLGMNPAMLSTVLGLARVWDAFTDPAMGYISDNCQHRWGRRKPFIIIGAIIAALIFPIIWFVPQGWGDWGMFWWLLVGVLMFQLAHTVMGVPYGALGLELTPDYHEKTRVFAFQDFFSAGLGFLTLWFFAISQASIFSGPVEGGRVLAILVAVCILVFGLIAGIFPKERYQAAARKEEKASFRDGLKAAIQSRPYLTLLMTRIVSFFGMSMVASLGMYLKIYFIFGGDTVKGAVWGGISGTAGGIGIMVSIVFFSWLSTRVGKRHAVLIAMGIVVFGDIAKWFAYLPGVSPVWMPVVAVLISPAGAVGTLVSSMLSDVSDYDEYLNGQRREGLFASFWAWVNKVGSSITTIGFGYVLVWIGFDAGLGANQSESTLYLMRILMFHIN